MKPGNWTDSDPFLLMAEDWFSTDGFDWHPHRGLAISLMDLFSL
ncbi:MAG TPA: hypothetical protein VEP90_06260 [Methylomirabilota bacterium]|nr:hypothetical protein [Methylomirabilota bacterium]